MEKIDRERIIFHERSINQKQINVHGFYSLCETIFGRKPEINSVSLRNLIHEISELDCLEQSAIEAKYTLYYKDIGSYPQLIALKKETLKRVQEKALRLLKHPCRSDNFIISRMIKKKEEEIEELKKSPLHDSAKISELKLSKRAYNALIRAGVTTVYDLENMKDYVLISIPGIGKKSLNEIWQKIYGKPYFE